MANGGIVMKYTGLLRAFNKIDMIPESKKRTDTLQLLNTMLEECASKDVEKLYSNSKRTLTVKTTAKEAEKILAELQECGVTLYSDVSNEEGLLIDELIMSD